MSTEAINIEVLPREESAAMPMHPAPVAEIQTINRYHQAATSAADEARSKAEEASHFALLAGTLLEDLRASTPHGEWGKLFRDRRNLTANAAQIGECAAFDFSSDAAARYIEVAKRIRMERSMSGKAQKQLAAIASAPAIDDDAREFLNNLTKGQTLRQLYLDLDIITAKPKEPKAAKTPEVSPRIGKSEAQLRLEDAREAWFLWREQAEKMIKRGQLEDLDKPGLEEMKEFQGWLRDRINNRLK
jgi:hypothetical protein